MNRALLIIVFSIGMFALQPGCEEEDRTEALPDKTEKAPLPYTRIEAGAKDPAQNGPDDDTVIGAVDGQMGDVKFPHFKHASTQQGNFGIPCVACHHTSLDKDPEEGCAGDCHRAPTKESEEAHQGPDDNMLLMGEDQDRAILAPVPFNHFTHASTKGYKVACDSCHHTGDQIPCADCHLAIATRTQEGEVVPKRKRAFHLQCKGCHENLKKNQPDSVAPTDCDACHTERALERLAGALSLERAFHLSCVSCHQKVALAKADTKAPWGKCQGCHADKAKAPSAADADVEITTLSTPNIDRGKEQILVDHAKKAKPGTPFAHHVHQQRAPTCNKCHHRGLKDPTCRVCHKDAKSAKKAYHKVCIGCHKENNGPTKCAVCHP